MTHVRDKLKGWRGMKSRRFLAKLSSGKPFDPPISYSKGEKTNHRPKVRGYVDPRRIRDYGLFNKET